MYLQVLGSGSWGLALARLLANNSHRVRLWAREEDGPDLLREERRSPYFLPGILLPREIEVSRETDPAVEAVVLAVPSHAMRAVIQAHPFSPATIRINVANSTSSCAEPRCSTIVRTPCRFSTICTAVAPEAVLTFLKNGLTPAILPAP